MKRKDGKMFNEEGVFDSESDLVSSSPDLFIVRLVLNLRVLLLLSHLICWLDFRNGYRRY